uniref:Xrn1 helical domain-containing protein n=1 Tax=Globodera rostochiensis TaxID=31243 RepID=A0A914I8U8_GLORO
MEKESHSKIDRILLHVMTKISGRCALCSGRRVGSEFPGPKSERSASGERHTTKFACGRGGCASWKWFFPYHHAHFAFDFELISNFEPILTPPQAIQPTGAIDDVFPATSRCFQGVALLPFVEEKHRGIRLGLTDFLLAQNTLFSLVHEVHSEGSRLKQEDEKKTTAATEMDVEATDGEDGGKMKQQIGETITDRPKNGTISITGVKEKK